MKLVFLNDTFTRTIDANNPFCVFVFCLLFKVSPVLSSFKNKTNKSPATIDNMQTEWSYSVWSLPI